jgi:hypothetical protein
MAITFKTYYTLDLYTFRTNVPFYEYDISSFHVQAVDPETRPKSIDGFREITKP